MLPPVLGMDYRTENENEEPDPRMIATMIVTKLAGRGIVRVVGRCNDAQENNNLGRNDFCCLSLLEIFYVLINF